MKTFKIPIYESDWIFMDQNRDVYLTSPIFNWLKDNCECNWTFTYEGYVYQPAINFESDEDFVAFVLRWVKCK